MRLRLVYARNHLNPYQKSTGITYGRFGTGFVQTTQHSLKPALALAVIPYSYRLRCACPFNIKYL